MVDLQQADEIYSKCVYESLTEWLHEKGPVFYHMVASRWNWDSGTAILDWIISQDDCDAGTAQAVFWLAEPFFYTESDRSPDGTFGVNDEAYRLILKIARRWEQGFYSSWSFSEATATDTMIEPIIGSRVVNDELSVPTGLDEKRHGAKQERPASRTLPADGIVFYEGIPESIASKCSELIGEGPEERDEVQALSEQRSLLDRLSQKF